MRHNRVAVRGTQSPLISAAWRIFRTYRYVLENSLETCYFIRFVGNLCGVFICRFMTF